jgi:hypothetical protein
MFTGCLWEPCFSHIANLLLLDQLKVSSVAKLLAASKQATFRTGNFRKTFLKYVAVKCPISVIDQCLACSCCASGGICRQVFDQGEVQPFCSCRFASYTKAQLQTFCLTRFSPFAILINSLQKYRKTFASAVTAPQYACAAAKSLRHELWTPPKDDVHVDLERAEKRIEGMEVGLLNLRALPPQIVGTKKYARIYQDVLSLRYWEALQV